MRFLPLGSGKLPVLVSSDSKNFGYCRGLEMERLFQMTLHDGVTLTGIKSIVLHLSAYEVDRQIGYSGV